MSESKPRNADAILGGQTPPPTTGAILGGLEGAKQRLESEALAARRLALSEAILYGRQGIDLAIQALTDSDKDMQRFAARLLRNQTGEEGKQALLKHQPLSYFSTLTDWRFEIYNPQIGITDPENNAYVVRMNNSGRSEEYDLSQFELLLQDQNVSRLEALVFQIEVKNWYKRNTFKFVTDAICKNKQSFPLLKALFVGDREGIGAIETEGVQEENSISDFRRSNLYIFDIRSFLEAFPKLEVLQIFGRLGGYRTNPLDCTGLRHKHLKSLIIEMAHISQQNIVQLCSMDLPNLEYLELWFGKSPEYGSAVQALEPVLIGSIYPNLKYLGLCSSEEAALLLKKVIESPIIKKLLVLDLKRGTLDDSVLPFLLDSSTAEKLNILNVSGNYFSREAVTQLLHQPYQVIAKHLFADHGYDYKDIYKDIQDATQHADMLRSYRDCTLYE
jgi:hypothetical protein